MACNEPYQNPAGLKFVTRVEIVYPDDLWPDDLAYGEDRLILNIPNGAGPVTLILQTENAYADWRIVGTKNLVRSSQRAYTGVSSWEQVWVEDGCFVYARAINGTAGTYNLDGLQLDVPDTHKLRALWYPNGASVPTFDRLSLISGNVTPIQPNGFPFRSIGDQGNNFFAPPGLCRYFQISLNGAYDYKLEHDGQNLVYSTFTAATGYSYGFCPAWCELEIINASGGVANYSVSWNRFPMTAGA